MTPDTESDADLPTARPWTAQQIGPLLRRAQARAASTFSEALQPLAIEGRHYGVLLHLHGAGPLSQRQLIDRTASDKSSMVRTVDDLEARGLVVRRPSPVDRRAYAVELTDAGREARERATRIADDVADRLLACLGPEERQQFFTLLKRFADAEVPPVTED